jgi:hypothetical protein
MIMHHIALCTPCIACYIGVSYLNFYVRPVEQELEELQEPTPIEEANLEQEQGKPQCITPLSLTFILN